MTLTRGADRPRGPAEGPAPPPRHVRPVPAAPEFRPAAPALPG